ncbi:PREDICTED: uncharacterized protein LOC108774365 [Cyphomyrmex costatus]|uniref:uncharacterized protein LOC108774365 n=1 Tax=Cyphomyrmex costatus TaxID=456900 RepID=UPI0008522E49|nr:PREDICTED: uncharacterized protein LOC108774365 [Cyphomyrmex costatus]
MPRVTRSMRKTQRKKRNHSPQKIDWGLNLRDRGTATDGRGTSSSGKRDDEGTGFNPLNAENDTHGGTAHVEYKRYTYGNRAPERSTSGLEGDRMRGEGRERAEEEVETIWDTV